MCERQKKKEGIKDRYKEKTERDKRNGGGNTADAKKKKKKNEEEWKRLKERRYDDRKENDKIRWREDDS